MKMWIARMKRGPLYLFRTKPTYDERFDFWSDSNVIDDMLQVYDSPEVTFENSPMEVELVLKK